MSSSAQRALAFVNPQWRIGMDSGVVSVSDFKREGKRFLHDDLICTYTAPIYISDINVDGLCIISVKLNIEK